MSYLFTAFTVIFFLFFTGVGPVLAAEIININYRYKIAFTDLTERDVKPGDLVHVTASDGKEIQLKVLETFPVMSKLSSLDGAGALTEEQFSTITVGSLVTADKGKAARPSFSPGKNISPDPVDDTPSHVEHFSPDVPSSTTPVIPEPPVKAVADSSSDARERSAVLERRLDQMMTNNVQLAENITQLLAEKNAAEAIARNKEADAFAARKKANELSDANLDLVERVKNLEAAAAEFDQEKAAQQKEIENLKGKLAELRKKLAKMVEIVNTNTKAYEKQ